MPVPNSSSTADHEAVRQDFPILQKPLSKNRRLAYLDNAASAQKPQSVIDKEREVYENYYANAYRGVYCFGARVDDELEAARTRVQKFLGAESPEEIVFTAGTTMAINLVAHGWGRKFLAPGDEILLNEMEHHANLVPWQRVAEETGARLTYWPLTDDGRLDFDRIDEVLNERTRLVAVTGMSNVLGTVTPIEAIAERAHERGALILVDAAQSVPHRPTDVQASHIDFLAFSGHKLYGPSGVGILYARRDLLDAMDPFLTGGHMIDRVYRDRSTWAEPPAKFEAGTLPIAQAIALGTAVDYVTSIGWTAIREWEERLLQSAWQRLQDIPRLRIYGPEISHRGAILSFSMEGAHPEDLAHLLDRRGVFVRHGHHCTMPLHDRLGVSATVRASFAFYNTEVDVEALIEALHFARRRLRLD